MNISSAYTLNPGYLQTDAAGSAARSENSAGLQQNRNSSRPADNQTFFNNAAPAAIVDFSPESRALQDQVNNKQQSGFSDSISGKEDKTPDPQAEKTAGKDENEKNSVNDLTDEERRQVDKLKKRDAEVKAHEQAHIAAGGAYVSGGASYEYEQGPDHRNYAVGGEVSIDTSAERTPEATIRKMQVVKRAALAPMKPSGQDRAVAAQAAQAEARARVELRQQRAEEAEEKKNRSDAKNNADPLNQTANQTNNNKTETNNNTNTDSATAGNRENKRQALNFHAQNQPARTARTAYQNAAAPVNPFNPRAHHPTFNAFA